MLFAPICHVSSRCNCYIRLNYFSLLLVNESSLNANLADLAPNRLPWQRPVSDRKQKIRSFICASISTNHENLVKNCPVHPEMFRLQDDHGKSEKRTQQHIAIFSLFGKQADQAKAGILRDQVSSSSRECHEDATRKLLSWNLGLS